MVFFFFLFEKNALFGSFDTGILFSIGINLSFLEMRLIPVQNSIAKFLNCKCHHNCPCRILSTEKSRKAYKSGGPAKPEIVNGISKKKKNENTAISFILIIAM